jgi:hypothetical protein
MHTLAAVVSASLATPTMHAMHAGVLKLNELVKVYREVLLRQPLPGREGFSQRCPPVADERDEMEIFASTK